jgi:hypothetical protein
MKSKSSDSPITAKTDAKARTQETGAQGKTKPRSASERATETAKRGEPLPPERRSDRSPKQENL